MKEIEIVLLLPCGKKQQRQFKTEEDAAEYLRVTHATEAPLSFNYADGSPVLSPTLERIYNRVFESFGGEKVEAGLVENTHRRQAALIFGAALFGSNAFQSANFLNSFTSLG